jgi:hypothetical protein
LQVKATDLLSMMNGTQYRAFKTLRGTILLNFRMMITTAGVLRDGVSRGTNVSVSGSDKNYYAMLVSEGLRVLSLEII